MSRIMILLATILFFSSNGALANTPEDTQDATTDRLPSVAMDEREKELDKELEALEQSANHQSPPPGQVRRSGGSPGMRSGGYNPADKCRDRCAAQSDRNASQGLSSFAISASFERCMSHCDTVEDLANEYMRCINSATTESQRQACHKHYRDNRWR
jgi:hypothetical protein